MLCFQKTLTASALLLAALTANAQTSAPDMRSLMLQGHEKMMGVQMTGNPDIDFAIAMREHHVGALDMAQWEIDHGKDPRMKSMARKIIVDQKKEIAQFDAFLKRAGITANAVSHGTQGGHQHGHSTK